MAGVLTLFSIIFFLKAVITAIGNKKPTIIKTGNPNQNFQILLVSPEQSILKSAKTLFYLFWSSPILIQANGAKFERKIFSIE